MKRILLIDGDILVYRTAFASEQVIDWGEGMITLHSYLPEAIQSVDQQIDQLMTKLKGDEYMVALTGHSTPNFRKAFCPQYKANRTEKRKPLVWRGLNDHLLENHDAVTKDNLEADDILGIWSTKLGPIRKGGPVSSEKMIVSIDKDFKTIPGKFFRLNTGNASEYGEYLDVTEEEADFNFMVQTLTGDQVDNYPGCTGIGPKRADSALKLALLHKPEGVTPMEAMWGTVLALYDKAGFGPDYALTQARCARILRASDYDFKRKEPILWTAPKL